MNVILKKSGEVEGLTGNQHFHKRDYKFGRFKPTATISRPGCPSKITPTARGWEASPDPLKWHKQQVLAAVVVKEPSESERGFSWEVRRRKPWLSEHGGQADVCQREQTTDRTSGITFSGQMSLNQKYLDTWTEDRLVRDASWEVRRRRVCGWRCSAGSGLDQLAVTDCTVILLIRGNTTQAFILPRCCWNRLNVRQIPQRPERILSKTSLISFLQRSHSFSRK